MKSSNKDPLRTDSSLMRISKVWSGLASAPSCVSAAKGSLDNEGVESGCLCNLWCWRVDQVLLLPLSSHWVLVSEDEVNFVGRTTLVWSEHDGERGLR